MKGWTRGKFEDDFESARDNGRLQFEQAAKLSCLASNAEALPVGTDSMLAWVDFTRVAVDPEFSHGEAEARTGPACHGVAFAKGTAEGPGPITFQRPGKSLAGGSNFIRRLDTDGDGRVSPKEFDGPADAFPKLDQNRDGFLTTEEAPSRPQPPSP